MGGNVRYGQNRFYKRTKISKNEVNGIRKLDTLRAFQIFFNEFYGSLKHIGMHVNVLYH